MSADGAKAKLDPRQSAHISTSVPIVISRVARDLSASLGTTPLRWIPKVLTRMSADKAETKMIGGNPRKSASSPSCQSATLQPPPKTHDVVRLISRSPPEVQRFLVDREHLQVDLRATQ